MTAETAATAAVPDVWVSVAEACRQLGISKVKFYELMHAGEFKTMKLPPHTQQARRKVLQASIAAFASRNTDSSP